MQTVREHLPVCMQTRVQTDQRVSKYETMQLYLAHAIVHHVAGVLDRQTHRQMNKQTNGQTNR